MNDQIFKKGKMGIAATKIRFQSNNRYLLYACVCGIVAFLIWASMGELAVISMSEGEVVPSSQVKTIQHLEGGIVRKISVREGDEVALGQPLVELESTATGADVTENIAMIHSLKVEVARLVAESKGRKRVVFNEKLVKQNPGLVEEALNLFASRRDRLSNELASQKGFISQRKEEIQEISARVRNSKNTLNLLSEQIGISDQLLKEELTNRYKHLSLLREASALKGSVEEGQAALERAKYALTQARVNLQRIQNRYDEETRTALEAARRQLGELEPRLTKFRDNLKRTTLRSPVSGIVKTVYVATIGGVIAPGASVVDIVPVDDRLVIEARLRPQDIGFVQTGQNAMIKLASSDALRFDKLEGKVVTVSPDTVSAPGGQPFYRVRIETQRDHFKRGIMKYSLFPGMQVFVSIHTGERTVMEYLMDPFLGSLGDALTER
ncbi:MAG: HlyD family type I secretion periplasmic adaptor subunit [Pseudomonadota bacterium]|nr:HlyD family type I secretion periplasmic adaptor subunit [Pseudomonadota bacterium]